MIQVKNLTYKINNKIILDNINLTLEENEFAAIIGPNGAGKSTLIKIILNIIKDYEGEILIDGVNNKEWLKNNIIGYLPQYEQFNRDFPAKAIDIVLMGIAGKKGLFKHFSKDDIKRAKKIMKQVNVLHLRNHLIGSLSGGELQRVFIARALISDSQYLILDEPEAGVDSSKIHGFYDIITDLNKQGKTILLISHDIGMVSHYSRFMICINKKLHCHTQTELLNAEIIKKTYGDVMCLVEKEY